MNGRTGTPPGRRALRGLDIGAVLAQTVFLALGVLAWWEINRLTGLGTSLLDAGSALDQAGRALADVARLPFVGPATGELADRVQQAAGSTRTAATDATAAIRQLAVIIAVAIALIPMPVLVLAYLPLRRLWSRTPPDVR